MRRFRRDQQGFPGTANGERKRTTRPREQQWALMIIENAMLEADA